MAIRPKKLAVIGLDCAMPKMIEKHIEEGHLPNFKKLIEKGTIADNCLVPYPTITPPNWATIATGAWAGTHGITDFQIHLPGTSLKDENKIQAFNSERFKAETIWDAADKASKKSIVINYPGAWPSKMKNGIVVGGSGMTLGEHRDGFPGLLSKNSICGEQLVTTGIFPNSIKGNLEEAEGWENVDELGDDPLEMKFELGFPGAWEKVKEAHWYLLVRESGEDGYDIVTLSPTKDFNDAFCTLKLNEWSGKIVSEAEMADGSKRKFFFRCKLVELADDAEDLRLYLSSFCSTSGIASPAEVEEVLESEEGLYAPGDGLIAYTLGWFDLETYTEIAEFHDYLLGDYAVSLMNNYDWDLFYMHSHPIDYAYHAFLTDMDPNICKDEEKLKRAWDAHLKIHQSQDEMIGRIMEAAGKETLFVLVSDHGATPDGTLFNPYDALVPAGLSVLQEEELEAPEGVVGLFLELEKKIGALKQADLGRSKAVPQTMVSININLKGREPDGIVEPEDYEDVQQEIIDALYLYRDPVTGKRPVALALTKRDARILGLHGETCGDVIYALNPWFGQQHGHILPTARWGVGDLHGLLVFNGSGIKKGHRLDRTVWLTDLVPTVCYLLDWPLPEQAEGAVIYQAFKDPNFKIKETQKYKDALERMEAALGRERAESWDKHDCA